MWLGIQAIARLIYRGFPIQTIRRVRRMKRDNVGKMQTFVVAKGRREAAWMGDHEGFRYTYPLSVAVGHPSRKNRQAVTLGSGL